jgi:hypothetical protein
MPPPASGGLSGPLAGIAAIPSRLIATRPAAVGLPGGPGRAVAGLARVRDAITRTLSNLASRATGRPGRPGNPGL